MKVIAGNIGDRDNGVRNAALNTAVQAYLLVGEQQFYKLTGSVSEVVSCGSLKGWENGNMIYEAFKWSLRNTGYSNAAVVPCLCASCFYHVSTIETKPFCACSSNLPDMITIRGSILLILEVKGQGHMSCCTSMLYFVLPLLQSWEASQTP